MTHSQHFIKVSCLARAEKAAEHHAAEIVVSLLSPPLRPPSFQNIASVLIHKSYYFDDLESRMPDGMDVAVQDVIALGQRFDRTQNYPQTLIHCHGGISRSTASAYILLASANPDRNAEDLFLELLSLVEKPWPNWRMVKMADALLGRKDPILAPLEKYRALYPRRIDAYHRLNIRRGIPHQKNR